MLVELDIGHALPIAEILLAEILFDLAIAVIQPGLSDGVGGDVGALQMAGDPDSVARQALGQIAVGLGIIGVGGHVIGAVSGIGGPALADQGFLKSATDSYIKATLMYGRIGTPMGAYLKGRQGFVELYEPEIDNIIAYLRSLQK